MKTLNASLLFFHIVFAFAQLPDSTQLELNKISDPKEQLKLLFGTSTKVFRAHPAVNIAVLEWALEIARYKK